MKHYRLASDNESKEPSDLTVSETEAPQSERMRSLDQTHAFHRKYYQEPAKVGKKMPQGFWRWYQLNPVRMIAVSFAFVILTGSILLSMPFSSAGGVRTPFIDALLTATSATCVTGLIIFDTATYWSNVGKVIIISLIQIGGLGLITILSFFVLTIHRRLDYRTVRAVQEATGADSLPGTSVVIRKLILITLGFEIGGSLILSWRFASRVPWSQALPKGFFHGISAFCNAGFDLLGNVDGPFSSLTEWNDDPIMLVTTALLLVFGGMGFVVWIDLFSRRGGEPLRFHTRLVMRMTLLLLAAGTLFFLLAENGNTASDSLGSLPAGQRPVAAFFQSATLRTAGFNSIDQALLYPSSKFVGVILMFIGASPVSTGGGIKTTTFALIIATILADLKGDDEAVVMKHRVRRDMSKRAFVIFVIGLTLFVVSTIWITLTEQVAIQDGRFGIVDVMYEVASAFGTVGVTSIGTAQLQEVSLVPLILLMYLGRVGPVSFAIGLALRRKDSTTRVLPDGRTFIG